MISSKRRRGCIFVIFAAVMFISWITYNHIVFTYIFKDTAMNGLTLFQPAQSLNNTTIYSSRCPDINTGMIKGIWKTRPLTVKEETEIELYLETVRTNLGIPKSMQRADDRCGNLTYEKLFWFRALCNPKGPTPCCYDGMCVDKSSDKCHCANCYDLRTQIHAEYSTWEPEDSQCQVKNYTAFEACHLLQERQLVVVGDSLMRHLYTALLLVLSNNGFDGALLPHLQKGIHDQCSGLYTFSPRCRTQIQTQATFQNRNGSISVRYAPVSHTSQAGYFMSIVRGLLSKPKTYILVSVGIHGSFRLNVYEEFLLPTLKMIEDNNATWPRIIWTTYHTFGILKTEIQGTEAAKVFNQYMQSKLQKHGIPIFDTSNVTAGVMSPDGAHFGVGVNVMKIQMFLNFFEDLKRKGQL